ncbi:unnamed protein product [Caenorhabditis sp. 36 PRJEB53466]|nr:unnamed protein product [Caenorhabditis sp. 36 PRJEB53466]
MKSHSIREKLSIVLPSTIESIAEWCLSSASPSSQERETSLLLRQPSSSNNREETSLTAAGATGERSSDWPWVDPDEPSTKL